MSLKQLKTINEWAHWEKRIASHYANVVYCSKQDKDPYIYDDRKQGHRSDVDELYQMIKDGASVKDIMEFNFSLWMRNYRAIQIAIDLQYQPRNPALGAPNVIWLYGPTGTGKTRYVYDNHDFRDIYKVDLSNDWTGYTQQKVVIIDEFQESMFNFRRLLSLLDRYPMRLNTKGSSVHFNSPIIYITSEHHPRYMFPTTRADSDDLQQLLRRLQKIENFGNKIPHSSSQFEPNHALPQEVHDLPSSQDVQETPYCPLDGRNCHFHDQGLCPKGVKEQTRFEH